MWFLANFLNDWWNKIRLFFHEMNPAIRYLLVATLVIIGLLGLIRFIKPSYSVDKNKFRIMPLIICIVFMGLGILIAVI